MSHSIYLLINWCFFFDISVWSRNISFRSIVIIVANKIFNFIRSSQYTKYASTLLKEREKTELPPYSHQALICANSKNKNNAEKFLNEVAELLNNIDIDSVEIWGPVPAVIEKKANYYYFNLYLQSINRNQLHRVIKTFYKHLEKIKVSSSVRWFLDVDPVD